MRADVDRETWIVDREMYATSDRSVALYDPRFTYAADRRSPVVDWSQEETYGRRGGLVRRPAHNRGGSWIEKSTRQAIDQWPFTIHDSRSITIHDPRFTIHESGDSPAITG
jgi:hypothetical protein